MGLTSFRTYCTGKSLSEALLFAEHGENMLYTEIVLNVKNNFCTQHVLPMFWAWNFHALSTYWTYNSMNNLLSYCGLVKAKIRASDKDLPVRVRFWYSHYFDTSNHGTKNNLLKKYTLLFLNLTTYFD